MGRIAAPCRKPVPSDWRFRDSCCVLPYGKKTSPLESFDFEEFPDTPVHEDYLWGNPAFAVALLLAQSFSRGRMGDASGQRDRKSTACRCIRFASRRVPVEAMCRDAAYRGRGRAHAGRRPDSPGLVQGSRRVRVARFQSIAEPSRGWPGGGTISYR